ncbi:MAG TPA: DUF4389 domain-containing protein [Mycobacteriales bacterium]|nr:DUF4389 domain-containing protein [Mycobacteriales bacterium]
MSAAAPPAGGGSYPLRLDGSFDPTTSRALWLVKWLLVVPHIVVLFFLWVAAIVTTVIAGFAILFTGRYPRSMFDFVVGVMRWTWRVGFYGISALGTDRYPPFSLAPDPTYPADLQVDYPEHLSRGLVLVKWWLLAIPQYIVVSVFQGGWGMGWTGGPRGAGGIGLISTLAVIGAVAMLVRREYPPRIFELVIGLDRWCFRVLAYALLLTDEYPPFRLDSGTRDPGSALPSPPTPI